MSRRCMLNLREGLVVVIVVLVACFAAWKSFFSVSSRDKIDIVSDLSQVASKAVSEFYYNEGYLPRPSDHRLPSILSNESYIVKAAERWGKSTFVALPCDPFDKQRGLEIVLKYPSRKGRVYRIAGPPLRYYLLTPEQTRETGIAALIVSSGPDGDHDIGSPDKIAPSRLEEWLESRTFDMGALFDDNMSMDGDIVRKIVLH